MKNYLIAILVLACATFTFLSSVAHADIEVLPSVLMMTSNNKPVKVEEKKTGSGVVYAPKEDNQNGTFRNDIVCVRGIEYMYFPVLKQLLPNIYTNSLTGYAYYSKCDK